MEAWQSCDCGALQPLEISAIDAADEVTYESNTEAETH